VKRERATSREAVNYAGSSKPSVNKDNHLYRPSEGSTTSGSSEVRSSNSRMDPRALEARQQEEKEFIRQHDTPESQLWFLVDVQWLTEWKQFVTQKGPLPGPIDNSRLLDRETGRPRPGLRPVDDYRGVNSSIWTFWHERYGGGPVVRRKQLNIYSQDAEEDSAFKRSDLPLPGSASTTATTAGTPTSSSSRSIPIPRADAPSREAPAALSAASPSKRGSAIATGSARGQSVPSARVSAARRLPPASDKPLCCDKCDGPHDTDSCPHFKKAREKHADAWSGYGKATGLNPGSCENVPIVKHARVIQQPADGSCLFHSLSYGLADRSSASSLRREICGFIAKNPDMTISDTSIKDWVKYDSNEAVSSYAQRMSGGTWGGGIEMAAMTRLKNVNVHVYEKAPDGYRRISAFELPDASKTISVLYQGRMHYDALVIA